MKRIATVVLVVLFGLGFTAPARAADSLPQLERTELQISYIRLAADFYQKIDAQGLLDGAHARIVTSLQKAGVAKPAFKELHAKNDIRSDARAFEADVDTAYEAAGGKLSAQAITYEAISGLYGAAKDRYTTFLSPKEYSDMQKGLTGGDAFGGVGLVIGLETAGEKRAFVQWTAQGGPADRAGVAPGDVIVAIDDQATSNLPVEAVSKALRGTPGTVVRLTLERAGVLLSTATSITRREIHTPSVFAKTLPNNVGFIAVAMFGQSTSDELASAVDKFEAQGVTGYVLDLRNNGGGYLDAAIDVSSKFIPNGTIVRVLERAGASKPLDATAGAIAPKPLAVLVNKYTASASEITAGALQDRGFGTLIGTRTFGKGVVQSIFPLPDGSAIKITTARYYTPRGRDINTIGIQPDIIAEENASPVIGDPAKDSQLAAALKYLQTKVAHAEPSR